MPLTILAVTGGFGTGKTTVAQMFAELGAAVLDVDALVRELEQPKKEAWKKIVESFGEKILLPDQSLNRRELARIVFSNPEQLQRLNSLVHPLVLKETKKRVIQLKKKGKNRLVVVDIPLLFEVGEEGYFDFVAVVTATDEQVIERLIHSRPLSAEEIRLRMKAQIPLEKKASRAHFVVDNNNGLAKTRQQVRHVFDSLKTPAGKAF